MANPSSLPHISPALSWVVSQKSLGDRHDLETIQQLRALATEIQHNPVLMRRLGDRVYELLSQEIKQSQERHSYDGGR